MNPNSHDNSFEGSKKYIVGVVRHDASTEFLGMHGFESPKNLSVASDAKQNQGMLMLGRVDLIMGNEIALPIQMKQAGLPFSDLEKVLLLIDDVYWMAFSLKTSDAVTERVQSALDALKEEQKLDEIYLKYQK